jgi:hypothetical protein
VKSVPHVGFLTFWHMWYKIKQAIDPFGGR